MTSANLPSKQNSFIFNHPRYLIKALIVEDDVKAQQLLIQTLKDYCPYVELVGIASSIKEGKQLFDKTRPDLIFLNTEINGHDTFSLLDGLKNQTFKVIFSTGIGQHALKAFKYGAVDYLLKPYSPQDILRSIDKVRKTQYEETIFNRLDYLIKQNRNERNLKISIPTSEGINVISINDLVRVEADRSYCFVCLSNGERILVSKPLKEIESCLPRQLFFRAHSAHLINMNYVKKYLKEDGGVIEMNDRSSVPLARRRKQEFLVLLSH